MIGWRNKKNGLVHAHSIMGPGGRPGYTLCGRVQLWESHLGNLRMDFKSVEPTPDMPRCTYCVERLQRHYEWLAEWLGVELEAVR